MKQFIFTNNKKIFKRVLAGAIALIVALVIVASLFLIDSFAIANPKCYHKFLLSTFNGSYNAENMPSTYWQVEALEDESGNPLKMKAKVELPIKDKGERYLGQIWINVSDLESSEIKIYTYYHTSNTTTNAKALNKDGKPFVLTANELRKSEDGWFKIYDFEDTENFDKAYTHIDDYSIVFTAGIRVREMVFVDTKYDVVEGVSSIQEYLEENSYFNKTGFPVKLAVDESKFFDKNKIKAK